MCPEIRTSHEGVCGSAYIDPHFLDLGTSWRWVVSFMLLPLYSRVKSPRYPLDRRLGGPQGQSGRRREDKLLDPHRYSNSDQSVVQSVDNRYTDWAIPAHRCRENDGYLLTGLSPSWGAANCAAPREFPSILWNPKVQYRVHKSAPLLPMLSHIHPIHSIPSYLRSILILSSHLRGKDT
jgi:hypothetical protein